MRFTRRRSVRWRKVTSPATRRELPRSSPWFGVRESTSVHPGTLLFRPQMSRPLTMRNGSEGKLAADVLAQLRSQIRRSAAADAPYPVDLGPNWSDRQYVGVVYTYDGRLERVGLCRDVQADRIAGVPSAEMVATIIRESDLEEEPPLEGPLVGGGNIHWWGDVGPDVPRKVWDRPFGAVTGDSVVIHRLPRFLNRLRPISRRRGKKHS